MNRNISFDDWIAGRKTDLLTTNFGSIPIAFQNWRPFKEAFTPELVRQAHNETRATLGRSVVNCIDPFGGSGTTALACQFLGIAPFTIEVNPYLADLIGAKLATYDVNKLILDFERVLEKRGRPSTTTPFPNAPSTFVEPGNQGRFLFNLPVAQRLATLGQRIHHIEDVNNRRLLRVLLGAISVDCSNVVVSGKGRRYRKNWQDRSVDPHTVDELFTSKVYGAIYEIQRYSNRITSQGEVLCGDARSSISMRRRFDMAIFSPPYPNSFDYTDVYNIELWVCGYLRNSTDNRKLRQSTIRSHVQIKHLYSGLDSSSEKLKAAYSRLIKVRKSLWSRNIPEMITSYFDDMSMVLNRLYSCLRDGGRCYIVVGDSQYKSVRVPVGEILLEIADYLNFTIVGSEPYRSMRAAPQQSGTTELLEQLVTLERPRRA